MSYERWSDEELKAECAKRGLKATGSKELFVERLETFDHVTGKHKTASEQERRALDEGLLCGAREGSLPAVRVALRGGANVNCVDVSPYAGLQARVRSTA
jgi:hypothetical protein